MSARHSAPLIFRLCPSMVNLPAYIGKRQSFMAQTLRRVMPRQGETPRAMQPGHGGESAVPDRTPVRGPDPTPAAHRGVEEYVGRVGRGRRGNDADSDQRIDGKIHVCVSAMSLKRLWECNEFVAAADHLIASGLVGEPTAPVIGIAGATNMNS